MIVKTDGSFAALYSSPELALVCVGLGDAGQLRVPAELHHVRGGRLVGLPGGHAGPQSGQVTDI